MAILFLGNAQRCNLCQVPTAHIQMVQKKMYDFVYCMYVCECDFACVFVHECMCDSM